MLALPEMPVRTMYSALKAAASRLGDAAALHQPYLDDGERRYRVYSWNEYRQAAEEIAAGLRSIGIRKGDIVGLDSETRAEFYLADLGIMTAGAVAAALYTSYPVPDLVRTLRAADARAVFVENLDTMAKLIDEAEPPLDVQWILLTGEAEGAISLDALRQLGRDAMASDPTLFERMQAEIGPEDYAILYLTSGATGDPKMGLVTHGALVTNIEMGPQVLDLGPQDSTLVFLPSAHITQRLGLELLPIAWGMPVWFSESLLRMPLELEAIKPTMFVAPPRMWERVHTTIRTELRKRPRPVQEMFRAALALGLEAARLRQAGHRPTLWKRTLLRLADRFVFARMRARFGGRMRICASGSAPLGKELNEFYLAIGLPLIEGYGLTEGGIVVFNCPGDSRAGSIGKALPGVEVRFAEDGELLVRGGTVFSGYYKDPETTSHVLRDGWLHTGDIAEMDSDGFLYITGRKKELIVSSNGKKIYPSRIEALFHLEPIISHVLLVGDRLPYVSALFTLNPNVVETMKGTDRVAREVKKAVERVNRNLAPFEQIRRYRVLDREFSISSGELTATLKLRRSRALENHRELVAEMYR